MTALYHFTYPKCLDLILQQGLLASNTKTDNDLTDFPVVWLTARPDLTPTLKQRKQLLRRFGILCGPKCRNLPDATVCLRVVMATRDRKLFSYRKLAARHGLSGPCADEPWFFYKGDIPASRLRVFKIIERGVPYWDFGAPQFGLSAKEEADLLAARWGPDDYVTQHRGEP
jgi:hypothetical protein